MSHGLPYKSNLQNKPGVEYIMGVDEAGRGPALGPMVYGAAWCPAQDKETLAKLGFRDSKQLNLPQREELFEKIRHCKKIPLHFEVDVISASDISQKMLRVSKYNLNMISHNACIQLVQSAKNQGFNISKLYVDTVGDKNSYQRKLKQIFPEIKIKVTEKADSLFPIVSAASICAKVIRDKEMLHYSFEEDMGPNPDLRFGSGYLADSKTTEWLARNTDKVFGFPTLVRFSWQPCQDAMTKSSVPVKWCRYGMDDGEDDSNQMHLEFSTRFRYFSSNDMEIVTDF